MLRERFSNRAASIATTLALAGGLLTVFVPIVKRSRPFYDAWFSRMGFAHDVRWSSARVLKGLAPLQPRALPCATPRPSQRTATR